MTERHGQKLLKMLYIKGYATPDICQGLMKTRRVIWMRIYDVQDTRSVEQRGSCVFMYVHLSCINAPSFIEEDIHLLCHLFCDESGSVSALL